MKRTSYSAAVYDTQNARCLVIAKPDISKKIEDILAPDFLCYIYESPGQMQGNGFREHDIQCVVIHMTNRNFPLYKSFIENLKQMHSFPVILLIRGIDIEVARICGKIGVDRFVDMNCLRDLKKSVLDGICQRSGVITLQELGIDVHNYPTVLQTALNYIQASYISLLNVSEVTKVMGVNEGTLSRLFKKHHLAGPKKLLIQCKLHHAIKLMNRKGLNIKKIARYSGFTSEKRFCESFNNIFHLSPNQYQKKLIRSGNE